MNEFEVYSYTKIIDDFCQYKMKDEKIFLPKCKTIISYKYKKNLLIFSNLVLTKFRNIIV